MYSVGIWYVHVVTNTMHVTRTSLGRSKKSTSEPVQNPGSAPKYRQIPSFWQESHRFWGNPRKYWEIFGCQFFRPLQTCSRHVFCVSYCVYVPNPEDVHYEKTFFRPLCAFYREIWAQCTSGITKIRSKTMKNDEK